MTLLQDAESFKEMSTPEIESLVIALRSEKLAMQMSWVQFGQARQTAEVRRPALVDVTVA